MPKFTIEVDTKTKEFVFKKDGQKIAAENISICYYESTPYMMYEDDEDAYCCISWSGKDAEGVSVSKYIHIKVNDDDSGNNELDVDESDAAMNIPKQVAKTVETAMAAQTLHNTLLKKK